MGLKIYVGCLPGDATESKVKEVFGEFGEVAEVTLVKKKSNKCVGSGYVTCANKEGFDKILKSEVYYAERKLETSAFLEKHELQALHEDINLRKLLVKNLPHELENEELEAKFSIFGEVINAFISTDQRSDGNTASNYGIVIFKERLGAYKALNGKFLLKGQPLIIRLHRFKNVGEAVYTVRGQAIKAKDLLDVQIGLKPKEDIRDLMPPSYQNEVFRFLNQEPKYLELMRLDRKKLKKDCKRKKDDTLRAKLQEIEKREQAKRGGGNQGGLSYKKGNRNVPSNNSPYRGNQKKEPYKNQSTPNKWNKVQNKKGSNSKGPPGLGMSPKSGRSFGKPTPPSSKYKKNQAQNFPTLPGQDNQKARGITSTWQDFDPNNFTPAPAPTKPKKKGKKHITKPMPKMKVTKPSKKGGLSIPLEKSPVMIFNNPEFDNSPGNLTTSSMREDDLYEWSKASLTPSNKLSAGPQSITFRRTGGRLSGGLSPGGEGFQNPYRKSSGSDLFQSKKSGGGSGNDVYSSQKYPSMNDADMNKINIANISGRGSSKGGRGSGGFKMTPESQPRKLNKERKRQLIKANSLLVTLNEIKEVEEEEKPNRFISHTQISKMASAIIYEDSKEQTSNNNTSEKTGKTGGRGSLPADQNNQYNEMAEMLYQQQLQQKSKKKSSDNKRQRFKTKGRGKSAILPDTAFFSGERDPTKRINYQDGGIDGKSPKLFNRKSGEYNTNDHFNAFSELHRGMRWANKSPDQRKYRSMKNFDEDTVQYEVDYKLQELNRRNKKNSVSLSSGAEDDQGELLDKDYYEFLQQLMDKDLVTPSRKQSETDKQSFLHHKNEKEWVKDWYKMVKNLRFKIHYNHFDVNLSYNKGTDIWKEIKDDLLKRFIAQFEANQKEAQMQKIKKFESMSKVTEEVLSGKSSQKKKPVESEKGADSHTSSESEGEDKQEEKQFISKRTTM